MSHQVYLAFQELQNPDIHNEVFEALTPIEVIQFIDLVESIGASTLGDLQSQRRNRFIELVMNNEAHQAVLRCKVIFEDQGLSRQWQESAYGQLFDDETLKPKPGRVYYVPDGRGGATEWKAPSSTNYPKNVQDILARGLNFEDIEAEPHPEDLVINPDISSL